MSEIKIQSITVNNMDFTCRTCNLDGTGELVILLHGFPESSIIWEPLMQKLADKGYRCLAPNQRGYSDGARPEGMENYTSRKIVGDVCALADVVGCTGKFHLVGHDWGGSIGWTAATLCPERIATWSALSTPHTAAFGWAFENDADQHERSAYISNFAKPDAPESMMAANDYAFLRKLWTGFDQRTADDFLAIFSQPEARTATINWYRALLLVPDAIDYQPISKTPVLFIWGNQDFALGRAAAEMTAQFVSGEYRFVELNAGHWLMEFNEPEVSAEVMDHIQKFPIV